VLDVFRHLFLPFCGTQNSIGCNATALQPGLSSVAISEFGSTRRVFRPQPCQKRERMMRGNIAIVNEMEF
jgi:hypothetical protein